LVHLSAIQRFELLRHLYQTLLIPPAVWSEVTVAGQGRHGAAELATAVNAGWIMLKAPDAMTLQRTELRTLDPGEAEALAVALDTNADLVLLDELRGRAVARTLGVRAIGTLGVLIEAKQRGLVPTLRGEIERLRQSSQLQLTPELEELALRLAGE
jgi:predicted nucleic acid-binding protein